MMNEPLQQSGEVQDVPLLVVLETLGTQVHAGLRHLLIILIKIKARRLICTPLPAVNTNSKYQKMQKFFIWSMLFDHHLSFSFMHFMIFFSIEP